MNITSIELTSVGGLRQSTVVGPFSPGLNILAAPNERGKTTLVKAASRALFDRHTCKDSEIKGMQPAGTELGPSVVVTFQIGAESYKIEKRFLVSPRCVFSQWRNDHWQAIAEGDQADRRMLELLKAGQPVRGASNSAHWGLFRFLWAEQGQPAAWPDWADQTGQELRSRFARIQLDPEVDRIRDQIWNCYEESFTRTGQLKTNGSVKNAQIEVDKVNAELAEIAVKSERLEQLQANYRSLGPELNQLETACREKCVQANQLRELAGQVETILRELKGVESEFSHCRQILQTVSQDQKSIEKADKLLQVNKEDCKRNEALVSQHKIAEAAAFQQLVVGESATEEKKALISQVELAIARVRDLLKFWQMRMNLDRLELLRKKIRKQQALKAELVRKCSLLSELTPARVAEIEQLEQSIREGGIQLEMIGLTLELVPDNDAKILGLESGPEGIPAGTTKTIKALEKLELQLEGWGTLKAWCGSVEAKTLATHIEAFQAELKLLLIAHRARTGEHARELLQERKALEHQLCSCEESLQSLLEQYESADAFEAANAEQEAQLRTYEAGLGLTAEERNRTAPELEAEELRLAVQFRQAKEAENALVQKGKALKAQAESVKEKRVHAERTLTELTHTGRLLEAEVAGLNNRYPNTISEALQRAQAAFVEAEARLMTVKARLPHDYLKLPERNRCAAVAAKETEEELAGKRTAFTQIEADLRARGSDGLYSKETCLLEQKEILLNRIESEKSLGWAHRLVHDLLEYRQLAATRKVMRPLEKQLSSSFADITGDSDRQVFLNENLEIRGVGRNEQEIIAFENLSQGAKEQLLLCLRLAVAAELAAEHRQLLVLDDILANTDPTRQKRVLGLLQKCSEKFQILILTCHPDRYSGVGVNVAWDQVICAQN